MIYEVHTVIQAKVRVEADSETQAFVIAEERARKWMEAQDSVTGKVIVGAREADEVV